MIEVELLWRPRGRDRDGNPHLGFDRIVGGSIEGFDAEVLLDPFEEEFDLPAASIAIGNVPS